MMICPKCGSETWQAQQVQHCDILVDKDNNWLENLMCYEAGEPFGPFTCAVCGHVEDDIRSDKHE